ASSKWFGSRSSSSQIRACSPSVRPSARWSDCSETRVRESSLTAAGDGSATASLQRMSRHFLPSFFLLAALWGASFMFIKVADRELQPTTMMAGRLVLAATILFVLLAAREG